MCLRISFGEKFPLVYFKSNCKQFNFQGSLLSYIYVINQDTSLFLYQQTSSYTHIKPIFGMATVLKYKTIWFWGKAPLKYIFQCIYFNYSKANNARTSSDLLCFSFLKRRPFRKFDSPRTFNFSTLRHFITTLICFNKK